MIQAKHVYINTGARPRIPDIPGIRETPGVYDSTGMLSLPELPRRVAVLGAGFIGLEFASMMADFGAEVCVLQHDYRVLPNEDADVVQAIHGMLEKQGVRIVTNANVTRVYAGEHGAPVVIEADVDGTATHFSADAMLVAVGRVPETAGLNLTAAGIETDARGAIIVDDLLRTTADQVWAMGDCNGGPQHTYISLDDSRIVWSQIGSLRESAMPYRRTERRNVPSCVFLHVPYARMGLNEHDATAQGVPVHVHALPVSSVPKAVVMRETEGLLKALTDPSTERILGVTLLCPEAHEMINTVKVAMDCGADANYMRNAIFTHPTMTEVFNDLFA
ncbi:pyridine nucleotide-disulfide oxidoreductase [Bifidobacterium pseudolongum subsp. globosum]|nr:pyridine nucleotide-disulfide oxidoreductase [Bifidobacterium pseudolongum subsp. globosum]RYQ78630.1 pyridine nucleotide-disulfide oxidoreductase [Bifidobacterium pseudolongum subsp. globosum]